MENVDTTYPMELVYMDYLTIEATEGGKDILILVITDILQDMLKLLSLNSQFRIYGIHF